MPHWLRLLQSRNVLSPLLLLGVFFVLASNPLAIAKDGPNHLKSLPKSMRDHSHPTVMVFHSPHCGTCKKMKSIENKLEKRTSPAVQWRRFNTADPLSDKMMKRFDVHVTPTYLLFDANGKGVYRMETMIRPAVLRDEILKLHASVASTNIPSKSTNKTSLPTKGNHP